ncbi:MAG: hypothetical protein KAW89_00950, partial [Armatimonadetes bacterium]|nr:hypothetical protein [Armatimonadota bacterium]
TFWVKATDRVPMEIANWAQDFSPYVHWTGFVTTAHWRKITFGGRITRPGYSGVKPVRIHFLVRNMGKPVTVWIDDLHVAKGPDFVTQAGWTPVAEGQNLIPNGSFEVDPSRDYLQYQGYHSERGPDENWQFSSDAAYGSRSLQLKPWQDSRYASGGPVGPALELMRPLAFDSADREFTLAVSVKLAKGKPAPLMLVLGPPFAADIPIPEGATTLEITPTAEWTRHQLTFHLPRRDDGMYFFCVRGGRGSEVLLDGLMLARGTSDEFRPRTPVEATLTSARPWRVYTPEDPLEFTLRAVRSDSAVNAVVELALVDYRQQTVRTVTWEAPTEADRVLEKQVTLPPLPVGCYRAELRLAGQPTVLSELAFSVMPQPRPVPAAQSNYGTNHKALFTTYNWDSPPMVERLGFRWARLWSMFELEQDAYGYIGRNMTLEQRLAAGDRWINNLKQRGYGILLSLHPRFKYHVSGPQPPPPATHEEFADYEANVRDIVDRFGDRIEAYEIGNEPCPPTTPAQYARMVRESVRILRELDPTATIISLTGAANYETAWIEQALAEGAVEGVDGISFHYGGQCAAETVERYRQIQEWATRGRTDPLQVWDSEEHMCRRESFYPLRASSETGVQELGQPGAYPALFTRDLKVYLCNVALGVRTFFFHAEYAWANAWQTTGYWERDGSLFPGVVANFLAAQLLQTFQGGGFYQTPDGVFIALAHDQEQSVLALWSENYTGTTKVAQYVDPFDLLDPTPRPVDDLAEVPDFYRDVHPVT